MKLLYDQQLINIDITIDQLKAKVHELLCQSIDKTLDLSTFLTLFSFEEMIIDKMTLKTINTNTNQLLNLKAKHYLDIPYEHHIFNIYKDVTVDKINIHSMHKLCYDYGIFYSKDEFFKELKSKSINEEFIIYTDFMLWWRHHKQLR